MPKPKSLSDLKSQGLSGSWQLDRRHRLTYASDEDSEQFELEASIVAAEPEGLARISHQL